MKRTLCIESCTNCHHMATTGAMHTTTIVCENKKAGAFPVIIVEQPTRFMLKDIPIPKWCPLETQGMALPFETEEVKDVRLTPASKTEPGTITLDLIIRNERVSGRQVSIVAKFTQDDITFDIE